MSEQRSIFYTDAPSNYDGFGTTELNATAGTDSRGRSVRKVSILDEHLDWQANRYDSGLYTCLDEASLDEWGTWLITDRA